MCVLLCYLFMLEILLRMVQCLSTVSSGYASPTRSSWTQEHFEGNYLAGTLLVTVLASSRRVCGISLFFGAMSSVQSRLPSASLLPLRGIPPCPTEILADIAGRLSLADLRTFVLGSSRLHDIGAYYLYRHVRVNEDCASDLLPALLLHTRPQAHGRRRSSPLIYIRSLSFHAIDVNDCIRLIPLLGEVLARASNVSFLHLDLPADACSFLISDFRRRGIVRTSLSTVWAAFEMGDTSAPSSLLALPRLAGFEITHRRLLPEFARFRSIRAIDIKEDTSRGGIIEILEDVAMMELGRVLEAFTCAGGLAEVGAIVQCVAITLPHLVYFGIRCPYALVHTHQDTQNMAVVSGLLTPKYYMI